LPKAKTDVLAAIAYYQPINQGVSEFFGCEISRDTIAHLRELDLIGSGPRSPTSGATCTYRQEKISGRVRTK